MNKTKYLTSNYKKLIPLLFTTLTLTACGGSGGGGGNSENLAPTASAGEDISVYEQTEVTLLGSGIDTDGTIVSYSWTQTAGTVVTIANSSSASATFTAPDISAVEQLTFQLTVTDNGGKSASDTVNIVVNPISTMPIAQAGADQSVMTGAQVILSGSGSDSDGEIVQYQWTQTSGETVTIEHANQAEASFIAPSTEQTLTFDLTVTDNDGNTASDSVSISAQIPTGFNLVDSQQQAIAYEAGTFLLWSVTNYDPQVQKLTWQVTTDAPLQATTFGASLDNPNEIAFTTLSLLQDTNVTISVDVENGGSTHSLSKTITMLADENLKFTRAQATQTALSQIGETGQMKITDINNDDYNDIVYAAPSGLTVFYGDENNSFSAQQLAVGVGLKGFAVVDINNDSLDDLLISYDEGLSWSANQGDNNFGSEQSLVLPENIDSVISKATDLDNDNDMDIAVIYRLNTNNQIQLAWFEQSDSGLKDSQILDENIVNFHNPYQKTHFALDDFNNDNKTDIIVATATGDDAKPVILYTQTDDGLVKSTAFNQLGSDEYYSEYADGILSTDINQDGYNDLITWNTTSGFNSTTSGAEYHINQQDGTFSTDNLPTGFGDKINVLIADADTDGDTDIVITSSNSLSSCDIGCSAKNSYAGKVTIVVNNSGELSSNYKVLSNPTNGLQTQVGDLDNDGDIDIINIDGDTWIYENKAN